jgi:rare lipoprotein A
MQHSLRRTFLHATTAVLAGFVGLNTFQGAAFAKLPGATHCYNGVCHRVKTIAEMQALVGFEEIVTASYYDDCKVDPHNPCTVPSSGEEFRADLPDNAASPVYPDGTVLALVNPRNDATAVVRVNNAGPYVKGRMLDVSRAAAEQLGFADAGIAKLKVTVISGPRG